MAAIKLSHGVADLQPQRPMGMGSTLVKVASNYALHFLRGNLGLVVG
jgi:hypothetical protein